MLAQCSIQYDRSYPDTINDLQHDENEYEAMPNFV